MSRTNDERRAEIARILCGFSEDERVLTLLAYAVGRSLERNCDERNRLSLSWEQTNMIRHVADWLKVSVAEQASWLTRVDAHHRPLKLMKFGSLEAAVKEADKATLKAAQKARHIKLAEGAEELVAELAEGYYLVRLLTSQALDAESSAMQHCIGNGAYDASLDHDDVAFYSLRDPSGKPHATLEVKDGWLEQCQGKQNRMPDDKYVGLLLSAFTSHGWKSYIPFKHHDLTKDIDHRLHDINRLPEGFDSRDNLNLSNRPLTSLPKGLRVNGALDIRGTNITDLPDGLYVKGTVYAQQTALSHIGKDVFIGNALRAEKTLLTTIPDDITIIGSLMASGSRFVRYPVTANVPRDVDLRSTPIASLPEGMRVSGSLLLDDCRDLSVLPERCLIGRALSIKNTSITRIPPSAKVGRCLYASGSLVEDIGSQRVWEHLDLSDTPIKRLPDGLTIVCRKGNGKLNLSGSAIEDLGKGLRVNGRLDLRNTPLQTIPDIEVRGELAMSGSQLTVIPPAFRMAGMLDISETKVVELPENLVVTGSLIAKGLPSLTILSGVKVGKRLDLSNTVVARWAENGSFGSVKCDAAVILEMPVTMELADFFADDAKIDRWPTRMSVKGDFSFQRGTAGTMPGYLSARNIECEGAKGLKAPAVISASGRVRFNHSRFQSYPEQVHAVSGDFRWSDLNHLSAAWRIDEHLLVEHSKLESIESGLRVFGDLKFSNTPLRRRHEQAETFQPMQHTSVRFA